MVSVVGERLPVGLVTPFESMPMDRIACPICGEVHDLSDMQVGFDKPDAWFALQAEERGARVALTPDVAVIW